MELKNQNGKIMKPLFIVVALALAFITSEASMANNVTLNGKTAVLHEKKMEDPIVKLDVVTSDSSIPKLNKDFEIPYVGKKLKIGKREYSASEMIDIADDFRTNLLFALRGRVEGNAYSFRLDSPGVEKALDSLKAATRKGRKIGEIFSAINVTSQGIEFRSKTKTQKIDLRSATTKSEINVTIAFDFKVQKENNSSFLKTNFKSFTLEMPRVTAEMTKEKLMRINGDFLTVSILKDSVQSNIGLEEKVNTVLFSVDNKDVERIEKIAIPFFDKSGFSFKGMNLGVRDIVSNMDGYSKMVQYGLIMSMARSVDFKTKLSEARDTLEKRIDDVIPLGQAAVLNEILADEKSDEYTDKDFVYLTGKTSLVNAGHEFNDGKNVIVMKLSLPKLKYSKEVDFGLFKTSQLDVDTDIYLKFVQFLSKKDHEVVMDGVLLDHVDMKISKDNISSLDLGTATAKLGGGSPKNLGKLRYHVILTPKSTEAKTSLNLEYKSMKVLKKNRVVASVTNKKNADHLAYDFNEKKWIVESVLNPYASISMDEVLDQIYIVVNALRGLREQVPQSSDFVERFEKVVYGEESKECKYSLLEKSIEKNPVRIKYQRRFANLNDFVQKYSESWNTVFKRENQVDVENPCKVFYLDAKKKEVTNEIIQKASYVMFTFNFGKNLGSDNAKILNEQLKNFSPNGQVRVDASGNVLLELTFNLNR